MMKTDSRQEYFDIFDSFNGRTGDKIVKFLIYKNGIYQKTYEFMHCWDSVQMEFGAGFFKVVCKTIEGNKYLAQQTMSLAKRAR